MKTPMKKSDHAIVLVVGLTIFTYAVIALILEPAMIVAKKGNL